MTEQCFKPDFSLPDGIRKASFNRLYSEAELYKAALSVWTKPLFSWKRALVRSHDGETLYEYAKKGHRNLARLHQMLKKKEFIFDAGVQRTYNFHGKERTLFIFPWEERIVDTLLYRILNRYFHSVFSVNTYAYRFMGFGLDPCQHRLKKTIREWGEPLYFIKRDIKNCFPSLPHDGLFRMLREWVDEDDYLFELLEQRIQCGTVSGDNDLQVLRQGVPFGTAVACFLANMYLTPIDRVLQEIEGIRFFRYADDILVCTPDRDTALLAEKTLDGMICSQGLESKPKHHQSFMFGAAEDVRFEKRESFRHLGLQFHSDGKARLSRDKGRKLRNLFRFAFRRARRKFAYRRTPEEKARLACRISKRIIEEGIGTVSLIDYYLKHIDDESQLKELDRWLAEEILARALGTGHKKGNFRYISFKQLREMGLPSFRHRRRLIQHGHIDASFFKYRTDKLLEKENEKEGERLPSR